MSEKEVMDQEAAAAAENAAAEGSPLSEPQLAELKEQAGKAAQYYEQLVRTTADFDNFKKRAARERQDAIKYANEALLEKLVPVLDNFDMALAAAQTSSADAAQSLQTG